MSSGVRRNEWLLSSTGPSPKSPSGRAGVCLTATESSLSILAVSELYLGCLGDRLNLEPKGVGSASLDDVDCWCPASD